MSAADDLDLMRHADGELELGPDGLDADVSAKLAALAEAGELVRGHLELSADDLPEARFDAVWREVDKAITSEAAGAIDTPAAAPATDGTLTRLGRWFERFRSHIITGALSAGAVAALALLLRPGAVVEDRDRGNSGSVGPIEVRPAVQRAPGVVEALDTPEGTGNVINVHDEDGNTTVIWVTPDDNVGGT